MCEIRLHTRILAPLPPDVMRLYPPAGGHVTLQMCLPNITLLTPAADVWPLSRVHHLVLLQRLRTGKIQVTDITSEKMCLHELRTAQVIFFIEGSPNFPKSIYNTLVTF